MKGRDTTELSLDEVESFPGFPKEQAIARYGQKSLLR
jgi:hypothetical protein